MADNEADFTIKLIDELTRPAKNATKSLQGLNTAGAKLARSGSGGGGVTGFVGNLGGAMKSMASGAMVAAKAILGIVGVGSIAAFGIAKLGSEAENSQNQIAGFLTALGFSSDFTKGLSDADGVIRKIKADSAALPGEAEDYIQVFKAGLPVLEGALGKNLSDITAFSNKFTAITNTLGIDTEQASRDLQAMLRVGKGGAGNDVRSFTQLLPFLHQLEGQANLTAESFNKMTQPERAKLLGEAMAKLDPMLKNAAGSFDAMQGALMTSGKEILRLATQPLFEQMKAGLGDINAALTNADGSLTPFAKKIVAIGKQVADFLVPALKAGWHLVKTLGAAFMKSFSGEGFSKGFDSVLQTLTAPETIELVRKFGSGLGSVASVLGTIFDWASKLLGPIIAVQSAIYSLYGAIFDVLSPLGTLAGDIIGGLINAIQEWIPSLVASFQNMGSQALESFKSVFGIASPSKEMAWVGEQLGAGLQIGTEATAPGIESSASKIGAAATTGAMDGGGGPVAGAGASSGSPIYATINVYQQPGEDGDRFARRVVELFEEQFAAA